MCLLRGHSRTLADAKAVLRRAEVTAALDREQRQIQPESSAFKPSSSGG